jgi:hypothetical protein
MNTIYKQGNLGPNGIQIRFNAIQTVTGPTVINSDADFTTLEGLSPAASPTVDAFFVDSINFCDTTAEDLVGCANNPGHELWLDSSYVAANPTTDGATDFAHELGHNLSLPHLDGTNTNLMNPVLGSTVLTADQITTILLSGLVQTDNGQKYIQITPIQVVPLPPALALFLGGVAALGGFARRSVGRAARTVVN